MTVLDELVHSVGVRRIGTVVERVQEVGYPDYPPLSVYLNAGVIPRSDRSDNHNVLGADLSKYQRVLPGDIVFNRLRTWQGGFGASRHEGIVSPAYIVVRPRGGDARFLDYLLHSAPYLAELTRISKWMPPSQFDVLWNDLRQVEVPWPATTEQRRIADFLDDRVSRIDRIITARREQVSLIAELRAEHLRLCVAGVFDESVPTQPTGIGWLAQMHQEALAVRLSRVVILQRGVDLTEDQRQPGDVKVVTTAGVVGTHDEFISTGPGVVIGRYGSVGNVHWVEGRHWPHNTTLYVRSTYGNNLRWIYYLLLTFPYEALQARAAVPGVNRNDMATEMVPWLPLHLQSAAVSHLDSADDESRDRTTSLVRSIDLLTEYKTSLITAAVTGELDVTTSGSNIPG